MNKVCIITGANSGIGKAVALNLAKKNYRLALICRNEERGLKALNEIIEKSNNKNIKLFIADLSLQEEIHKLVIKLKKEYPKIDILINNASILSSRYEETKEGIEKTFATNYFAYFLLTNLLLENLKAAENARIINIASQAKPGGGNINFNDLYMKKNYKQFKAYGNSKLADIIFSYELARKLKSSKVCVYCIHPGSTKTNISKGTSGVIKVLYKVTRPFQWSPEKAADAIVWVATSKELEGVTGKYFFNKKEIKSKKISYNTDIAKKLWDLSEKITQLKK